MLWKLLLRLVSGGSRHSAGGQMANLICFPVSHVNFFVERGKSIAKLDGGHGRIVLSLDPTLGLVVQII